jgi:hypothetical protein
MSPFFNFDPFDMEDVENLAQRCDRAQLVYGGDL